jgi:hypothetical protein
MPGLLKSSLRTVEQALEQCLEKSSAPSTQELPQALDLEPGQAGRPSACGLLRDTCCVRPDWKEASDNEISIRSSRFQVEIVGWGGLDPTRKRKK